MYISLSVMILWFGYKILNYGCTFLRVTRYFAKVDGSGQKPRRRHLSRPHRPFWDPFSYPTPFPQLWLANRYVFDVRYWITNKVTTQFLQEQLLYTQQWSSWWPGRPSWSRTPWSRWSPPPGIQTLWGSCVIAGTRLGDCQQSENIRGFSLFYSKLPIIIIPIYLYPCPLGKNLLPPDIPPPLPPPPCRLVPQRWWRFGGKDAEHPSREDFCIQLAGQWPQWNCKLGPEIIETLQICSLPCCACFFRLLSREHTAEGGGLSIFY